MRILLLGGTRFLGYHVAWRLLAAGHALTLLTRGQRRDPFGVRVERLPGDRTTDDLARVLQGRRFDAAVDFTAYRGADVRRVIEVMGGRLGHYVLVSSGQVYLVREGSPWPAREEHYDGPVMEAPHELEDWKEWDYGVGKRECEDTLREANVTARFPGTALRLPIVNGERDHSRRLEAYLWRILDGGPVLLPDGGTQPVRHVYVGAVARAVVGLLGRPETFGRAYNLAQEETPTLAEVVTLLADVLGAPARLAPVPAAAIVEAGLELRAVSPFTTRWASRLDPSRAKAELGFRHESLRTYLERTVSGWLACPPDDAPPGYERRAEEIALATR
jgi:nucleoside-diphosphate-sugar epimerase